MRIVAGYSRDEIFLPWLLLIGNIYRPPHRESSTAFDLSERGLTPAVIICDHWPWLSHLWTSILVAYIIPSPIPLSKVLLLAKKWIHWGSASVRHYRNNIFFDIYIGYVFCGSYAIVPSAVPKWCYTKSRASNHPVTFLTCLRISFLCL